MLRISGAWNFETLLRNPTLVVWLQLPLRCNTYFFQYWYWELWTENRWGRDRKYCFGNFFFGSAWIVDWWRVVRSGRKSYLWAAEIASLYSRDFNSNKHDTFWHVVTTGYFYVLFLWIIAISDCLLEIYKNVGFLLSTIAFTVNSHADDHIIESYISFFIKIHVKFWPRFLIFKLDLNVKHCSYFL